MRANGPATSQPKVRGLPAGFGFGAQAAGFGGDGFLHGGRRDGDDEVHHVFVGQARVGVAGHHVAGLREDEAAAEDGGEVVGVQGGGVLRAQDVELGRAATGAFGTPDFVQVGAEAGEKHVVLREGGARSGGFLVVGDAFAGVALDVGEAQIVRAGRFDLVADEGDDFGERLAGEAFRFTLAGGTSLLRKSPQERDGLRAFEK